MKVLKWFVIVVVALLALLAGGGLMLSPQFKVVRTVSVNAPPEKVYALVVDPRRWKQWTVWNERDPAMQITYSGPPEGKGAGWAWKSKTQGDGSMTFTDAQANQRLAYDLYFPDFGTTSQGELSFSAKGATTEVSWTMNGNMGKNPLFRWMTLFTDSMVGKDFEAGLARLKNLAEKP